ncbi:MFS transporter [Nonomuraea jiangxiensis]|uniref:Major Facilitator Superfamily protein n=1 Tax=Nonomuraea jiangxiensis TaxID=633440 RepID=A0A1G8A8K1_9ACTN|nr:MFS transporter [Nonomuraea jiangxiensis]SDH17259.1 Major Facilitator Superfamily protein [Nonomuraea jiangxiensis]
MRRSAQVVISATVFVDLLGFTVILPGLPFFAARLGADGAAFGLVMSAYSIAQFACAPLLGRLSDRYGRRPLVLLALAGSAVSLALTGAAGSPAWLLACRLLAGACGGSISVAHAYVADTVPAERRTGAMAQLGAAIGVAFVVGPALGALLAPWGFAASAYAAAALAAANLVAAAIWLPEPNRPRPEPNRPWPGAEMRGLGPDLSRPGTEVRDLGPGRSCPECERRGPEPDRPRPGAEMREPGPGLWCPNSEPQCPGSEPSRRAAGSRRPAPERSRREAAPPGVGGGGGVSGGVGGRLVVLVAVAVFLAMTAFVGMETTLAFLGNDRYGWDTAAIGLILSAAGLSMAAVQAGPVALLSRKWGEARVAAAGAALMAGCLPVIPLAPEDWSVVAVCLLSAGHGLLTPTLNSLLAGAGAADRSGARLGLGQSAAAGGRILGPAAAGLLFDLGAVLPYVAGAILAGLAMAAVLALHAVRDPVEESA